MKTAFLFSERTSSYEVTVDVPKNLVPVYLGCTIHINGILTRKRQHQLSEMHQVTRRFCTRNSVLMRAPRWECLEDNRTQKVTR